ncbi:MAG: histidinol-phosphate transaminase [Calditrichaeota bacterium]|nr:histidinol-phosphate transaminase [Calditrichota bacterium]
MKVQQLIRPEILRVTPYRSAREEYRGKEAIWLDANENAYDIHQNGLNRYPDPLQWELKQRIAAWKGVSADQIFLGNGSDEAIDLLIRATCRPFRDEILITPPTYGMYQVLAEIQGVGVQRVVLNDRFQLDLPRILSAISFTTRLIFLCSPNNPTGNVLQREDVDTLLKNFPGLVVIDEAYIDFADDPGWLAGLNDHPNLVILQTFSKALGLAGARLGMAFAHREIIAVLNKIKFPYNVNELTLAAAHRALDQLPAMQRTLEYIREQRQWLYVRLKAHPDVVTVYPSQANFLLVRFRHAASILRHLLQRGIVVRDRSRLPQCEGCLRITVGTEEENRLLIQALNEWELVQ